MYKKYKGKVNYAVAYASQRVKVRSFIKWFHNEVREDSGLEWVCYIDDDMYVNVHNLNNELAGILANPPRTCSRLDRCMVADANLIYNKRKRYSYPNTVWCMTIPTVNAVAHLLQTKSDDELGWTGNFGTDDVGLAKALSLQLNLALTDSLSMFSINNRVVVTPPARKDNPVGSYTLQKANIRGNKTMWTSSLAHLAASDVLARLSVLNLPHVNFTDFHESHGSHYHQPPAAFNSSRPPVVGMKPWHAFVKPLPTCRQQLNLTLHLENSDSYILKYKM